MRDGQREMTDEELEYISEKILRLIEYVERERKRQNKELEEIINEQNTRNASRDHRETSED